LPFFFALLPNSSFLPAAASVSAPPMPHLPCLTRRSHICLALHEGADHLHQHGGACHLHVPRCFSPTPSHLARRNSSPAPFLAPTTVCHALEEPTIRPAPYSDHRLLRSNHRPPRARTEEGQFGNSTCTRAKELEEAIFFLASIIDPDSKRAFSRWSEAERDGESSLAHGVVELLQEC
jgi:hypothetical protein